MALYLFAAAAVVVLSFVLVAYFAGEQVGAKALEYPRLRVGWLTAAARSGIPQLVGGVFGVAALVAVIVTGLAGTQNPTLNPAEYLTWIYFWAALVILSGFVGNIFALTNPWAAIYAAITKVVPVRPAYRLPDWVGIWPAVVGYFGFACLELTTGQASHPRVVGTLALVYTLVQLAGMLLFGREWLQRCEAFTVLFGIVGRFGPVEIERDAEGRIVAVYLRPWGVGLLKSDAAGWDWVMFVILTLSSLAFDGMLATNPWFAFQDALVPRLTFLASIEIPVVKTLGLLLITACFLFVFVTVMQLVIYFGVVKVDRMRTITAFAFTLVPIALVYNAAHNYSYLTVQAQGLFPLLRDPLGRGPEPVISYNFALAAPVIVWWMQIVLIVLGHVVAVWLAHLRAGERFKTAKNALLSQYPMLLLMVLYTMTSLWILAQPITREV